MCVITICKSKREDTENPKAMATDNPDGTGVIYYKDGMPHYRKNIDIKEVLELNKTLEFPYAFHFRFVTVGKNKLLTHPYEVSPKSELRMEGSAEALLMHNGHWGAWDDTILNYSVTTNKEPPGGDWSDSRAMAYLAGSIGPNVLKMLTGQKIALFKRDKKITIYGSGWEHGKEISYSNKNWETPRYNSQRDWRNYNYKEYNTQTGAWSERRGSSEGQGSLYEWNDVRKEVKRLT